MHWPQDLGLFCNYYWYDNGEEKHRLQSCIENWYGKEAKIKNPPHQCDKCGHCCGIMNSPQHPGLPPHGAGDLQPLVLTVPLLLLSNTIDVPISPFFFFQIHLSSIFPLLVLSNTIEFPFPPFSGRVDMLYVSKILFDNQAWRENTAHQMMTRGWRNTREAKERELDWKSVSNRMIRCWAKPRWSRLDEDVLLQVLPLLACPHCYS